MHTRNLIKGAAIGVALATGSGFALPGAASAAVPNLARPLTSCTGSTYASASVSNGTAGALEYFWWTQQTSSSVCIGQVDLKEGYDSGTGLLERVRVWSTSGSLLDEFFSGGSGAGTGTLTFVHHVNLVFGHGSVQVCTAVVHDDTNRDVDTAVPILCKTV